MDIQRWFNNLHYFNIPLVLLEIAIYFYSLQCNCDAHLSTDIFINTRSIRSFKFPEEQPRTGETSQSSDKAEVPTPTTEVQLTEENIKVSKSKGSLQMQRDKKTFFNFLTNEEITSEDAASTGEEIVTDNKYHSWTGSIKRQDIKCPPCQIYTTNGCQLNLFNFDSDFDESCVIYNSASLKETTMLISVILLGYYLL